MSGFNTGDEAVYVGPPVDAEGPSDYSGLPVGSVHIVRNVVTHSFWGWVGIVIDARPGKVVMAHSFRKVVRRDLSAWLETAATDTDRWDKPIKAPAPLHPVPSVDALFRRIMAGGDR